MGGSSEREWRPVRGGGRTVKERAMRGEDREMEEWGRQGGGRWEGRAVRGRRGGGGGGQ